MTFDMNGGKQEEKVSQAFLMNPANSWSLNSQFFYENIYLS